MAFAGKYELVNDEGHYEHMIATGLPEEIAKKMSNHKNLEIVVDGSKIQFKRGNESEKRPTPTYVIGEVTEDKTPDGKVLKNKTTLNGNTITIETDGEYGSWKRSYTISGSELTVVSSSSKAGVADGKRIYKKL